jgi:outer membrane murein-binding lipoprotein Lpp
MKRLIASGVVASVLLVGGAFVPRAAQATDPITRLQRQVRSLQSQVNNLKNQVQALNRDVFVCTFYATPGEVFDDGTVNYDLYYDGSCI